MRFINLLRRALERSPEPVTEAEVLHDVQQGYTTVFADDDAILLAQIIEHGDGSKTGHCWLASGDMEKLVNKIRPEAEQWARHAGANRVTIEGRKGWVRALKNVGYAEQSVTLVKDLTDG